MLSQVNSPSDAWLTQAMRGCERLTMPSAEAAGTSVQTAEIRNEARTTRTRGRGRRTPVYELSLTAEDITQIEKIAGEELRRLGYTP